MTNEELLADLKQFIEATISQQLSRFATKDDLASLATKADLNNLRVELKEVDEKLDVIQDAIAETLTQNTNTTNTRLDNHEQRLRRLEHRAA